MSISPFIQDSLSFSQALRRIKTDPPSQRSTPPDRPPLCPPPHPPQPNYIQRKNTNLRSIFHQFLCHNDNQYVLRLNVPSQGKTCGSGFDQWVTHMGNSLNFNDQLITKTDQDLKSTVSSERQTQIRQEIAKNIEKFTVKMEKTRKKTENSDSRTQKEGSEVHLSGRDKTKYSFAGYFNECEPLTTKLSFPRGEVVTKISIANEPYLEDEVIQQPANKIDPTHNDQLPPKMQNDPNKENMSTNTKEKGTVRGLQFSKKRRFKSTKRSRKPA